MILVVGLSPAWQRTLEFGRLRMGEVNRARCVTETASGKGVNVARVASQLGAVVRLLTVAGGRRGRQLADSMRSQGLPAAVVRVEAETRVCQTLVADDTVTELVEEASALTRAEVAAVLARFDRELLRSRLVVLTGTVPPGCGDYFYSRLIVRANRAGMMTLVDAQGAQLANAAAAGPFVVKVNRNELTVVSGLRSNLAEWLVVTDGPREVVAMRSKGKFRFSAPRISAVNPIGSGDAMLAGIACALTRGRQMREAIRLGIACGAANALTPTPGMVRRRDVQKLLRRVR